jgi:hypothetical protein
MGKRNHGAYPVKDFLAHTAGGKGVVVRDVFPNFSNAPREGEGQSRALRSLLVKQVVFVAAKALKKVLAVNGLYPTAFQVVIPAVEHFACLRKLVDVSTDDILHK